MHMGEEVENVPCAFPNQGPFCCLIFLRSSGLLGGHTSLETTFVDSFMLCLLFPSHPLCLLEQSTFVAAQRPRFVCLIPHPQPLVSSRRARNVSPTVLESMDWSLLWSLFLSCLTLFSFCLLFSWFCFLCYVSFC